jgi:hypothetical protein
MNLKNWVRAALEWGFITTSVNNISKVPRRIPLQVQQKGLQGFHLSQIARKDDGDWQDFT